jgi:hypothetical protein
MSPLKRSLPPRVSGAALVFAACVLAWLLLAPAAVSAADPAPGVGGKPCEGVPSALVAAPFDANYDCRSLGAVPGVPDRYGGIAIKNDDADTLIIGGAANSGSGRLYKIRLARDGGGHVTGFKGEAELYGSDSPPPVTEGSTSAATTIGYDNDGGVTFGPGGLLFTTLYPANKLAQTRPGTDKPAKLTDLTALGIASSVGAVFFVPPGFPAAGSMKIASYDASRWYSVEFKEDGAGTYDLTSATQALQFTGGPEGITYVPQGSKSFARDSILIALYQRGAVVTAPLDADGNPRMGEAQDVITGLQGAEGAVIDPKTGDFLFSTFGGGKTLVRVTGFKSLGGVAQAYRPSMVRSVPSPADISTNPDVVGTNLTLAVITMLCIFVAAQLFNSTISENKDEIEEMLAPVTKPLRSLSSWLPRRKAAAAPSAGLLQTMTWPTIILGLTVLIYGFTNPGFGMNGNSAILALSLLVTMGLVTYVTEGGEAYVARTSFGQETGVRPYPLAIIIAIVNVAICRAVGFGPGVIYGFVGTAVYLRPSTLTAEQSARTVFLPAVAMLGVSLAAWLLVIPVRALAENYDAAVPAFFEGIAVTLFVAGLQGTFLNMIPLSFMDGQKIWRWRKIAWAGLTVATALLFWHVLINSDQSYLRALSSTVSAAAFALLSASVVLSGGVWLFFHRRKSRTAVGAP